MTIQHFIIDSRRTADNLINLLSSIMVDTGSRASRGWQSNQSDEQFPAYELANVVVEAAVPERPFDIEQMFIPDLPWAREHFAERVGGRPLNPPPSYVRWPWHSANHTDDHIREGKAFDHSYPERFWPKYPTGMVDPTLELVDVAAHRQGIRFKYGDLADVVAQLKRDPFTRQAYLPVWFPEDTGAVGGMRVPCSLGYHFIRNGADLDMNYFLRSCDLTRHFRNDLYFAASLLRWVTEQLRDPIGYPGTGTLTMFVSNLHLFAADEWRYTR